MMLQLVSDTSCNNYRGQRAVGIRSVERELVVHHDQNVGAAFPGHQVLRHGVMNLGCDRD